MRRGNWADHGGLSAKARITGQRIPSNCRRNGERNKVGVLIPIKTNSGNVPSRPHQGRSVPAVHDMIRSHPDTAHAVCEPSDLPFAASAPMRHPKDWKCGTNFLALCQFYGVVFVSLQPSNNQISSHCNLRYFRLRSAQSSYSEQKLPTSISSLTTP